MLDIVGIAEMNNTWMLQPGTHILMIKAYFWISNLRKIKYCNRGPVINVKMRLW